MSVSDNYLPVEEIGNGVTTVFTGNWNPISNAYCIVELVNVALGTRVVQTEGVDYSLTFNSSGYTVTFLITPPPATEYVVISRDVTRDQSIPFRTSKGFQGANVEGSLDKITAQNQDQQDAINRSIKLQVASTTTDLIFPEPVADTVVSFNSAGDQLEATVTVAEISNAEANATAAAASASAASTSETNAAASASAASTSETNAAASAAAAQSVASGIKWRNSVRVSSTANLTLSGEQTIDGILTTTDRVLVKNQTVVAENGIYVSGSGVWVRASDFDEWTEIPSTAVTVEEGSTQADTHWICTSNEGGTLDTTDITFSQFGEGDLQATNNLSELTSAATARTNLGLGTISTQDGDSVAITGGVADGMSVGSTTPATGKFTTSEVTGHSIFAEIAAPSTPSTGKVVLYAKSDGLVYSKDDAGVETLVSSGAGGVGKLIQTVYSQTTTDYTITSTSYTDISSVSITPTSASNYIKVTITWSWRLGGASALTYGTFRVVRDSTALATIVRACGGSINEQGSTCSVTFIEQAQGTSTYTYKGQLNRASGSMSVFSEDYHNITVEEIEL